jgi:DNA-directed RNA polymerase subunit E'/Rpb7
MFQIARLEDPNVKILPENLGKPRLEAVTQVIESLYEIVSITDGTVYPGEGSAHFHVVFKAVVFRPFVGEVLEGKLQKATAKGLYVSLGFFDDVFVPEHMLQEPSAFDETEQLWTWNYMEEKMFMDLKEPIRFRVSSVRFPDQPRSQRDLDPKSLGKTPSGAFAPMVVVGDINADGLGLTSWWQQ